MFRVSDVPAEVWSLIFEHLNLEDLVDVNSACAPFWGSITRRVARVISLQHYSPFPADSFCVHRLRQSPGKDGYPTCKEWTQATSFILSLLQAQPYDPLLFPGLPQLCRHDETKFATRVTRTSRPKIQNS